VTEKETELKFSVNEFLGSEVFLLTPEEGVIEAPLQSPKDLYDGLKIAVPTLFGYAEATVVQKDGQLFWESHNTFGPLLFGQDERSCWISGGIINKKGLDKLSLTSEGKTKLPVIS